MSSASNRAKSSCIRNSSSMALIISSIPNESITPLNRKSKSSGSSARFSRMAVIGSEYLVNRNFRTLSGVTSFICLVESRGVSVHGRPKIEIILEAVEAPAHRLMQRSEACFGLVDPEEPGVNAALVHHTVKIILQSKKVEGVSAQVVKVIVVHPLALKLKTDRAEDPATLAVNDHPLFYDIAVQAIFGGQVIGVFVESLKETFVELVDVGRDCVFQCRIWPLCGQLI